MMPRLLMLCRVVLGVLLIRQGAIGLSDLVRLADRLEAFNAWQAWPLVGSLRPMELAIWIGASEFAIGIFLVPVLFVVVERIAGRLGSKPAAAAPAPEPQTQTQTQIEGAKT